MNKQVAFVLPIIISCLILIPACSAMENLTGTETVLFSLKGEPSHLILDGDRLFWLQDSKYLDYAERGMYLFNCSVPEFLS